MSTWINPYIMFTNQAQPALEFYAEVFGGNVQSMTFGQAGAAQQPEHENLIMHGHLETTDGWTLMAADSQPKGPADVDEAPIRISIGGKTEELEKAKGWFDKLAEGGKVEVPLEKQMWGDSFGMVRDKFGVTWMINIAGENQGEWSGQ